MKKRMNRAELKAHRQKMKAIGIDDGSPLRYEGIKKVLPDEHGTPKDGIEYYFGMPKELNFKRKH